MQNPITKERYKGVNLNETLRRQICDRRIHAVYFLAAIIAMIGITVYAWNNPNPKVEGIKNNIRDTYIQYNKDLRDTREQINRNVNESMGLR